MPRLMLMLMLRPRLRLRLRLNMTWRLRLRMRLRLKVQISDLPQHLRKSHWLQPPFRVRVAVTKTVTDPVTDAASDLVLMIVPVTTIGTPIAVIVIVAARYGCSVSGSPRIGPNRNLRLSA